MQEIVDIKKCESCNKSFGVTVHKRSKKFCDDECRMKVWKSKRKAL